MDQASPNSAGSARTRIGGGAKLPIRVWDAPIRISHWGIAALVPASWLSAEYGWMQVHLVAGYTMLAVLLFRLAWGFIGSDTARFSAFVASPAAALLHLRHMTRREADTQIGHNAAGGWMVLLLLALLALQAGSGLFANTFDDYDVNGPLADLVSRTDSDWLSQVHSFNFNLILAAIVLHVLAVLSYCVLKRQDLVSPMVTGKKRMHVALPPPRMRSSLLAALIFLCAAGLVAVVATRPWDGLGG